MWLVFKWNVSSLILKPRQVDPVRLKSARTSEEQSKMQLKGQVELDGRKNGLN